MVVGGLENWKRIKRERESIRCLPAGREKIGGMMKGREGRGWELLYQSINLIKTGRGWTRREDNRGRETEMVGEPGSEEGREREGGALE